MNASNATHTLVHVAAADGFEFVLIVGTFAQCEELQATYPANLLEAGTFEIRETAASL